MKFDHLGVIVSSLEQGRQLLFSAVGVDRWTREIEDPGIGVAVQFGLSGTTPCIELVAPLNDSSPVSRALRQGVNVLNHLAYLTDDLGREGQRLVGLGFTPLSLPRPAIAYGGSLIQFFASEDRLMLELVEAPDHEHRFLSPG